MPEPHRPHWEHQLHTRRSGLDDSAAAYVPGTACPFKVRSLRELTPGGPAMTDEGMGWLAYLKRRVDYGGTWGIADAPHLSWDNHSFIPVLNYYRYDLTWQCYALALIAQRTPAWREVTSEILDFAAQRFLEYHSFFDWVENRGADPDRDQYPPEWVEMMIPPGYAGKYDVPGWSANGMEPFAYDPDPVRGNGSCMMMYKAYLNLVLGMYASVSGDDKYDHPFKIVYNDDLVFQYDAVSLNELIAEQMWKTWSGVSCEVTKAYGWCNNIGGISLKLFDNMHGTQHTMAYDNFKRFFRDNYITNGHDDLPIESYAFYYDRTIDVYTNRESNQLAVNWMMSAFNGIPLDQRLFERMYEGGMNRFYQPQPDGSAFLGGVPGMDIDDPFSTVSALSMSREVGDDERHASLRAWAQKTYQPTWDEARGEFYFHFNLDEPFPRAQFNHMLMPGLVSTGAHQWSRAFNQPNLAKFTEPTVTGVDFPTVRPRQAYWDKEARALHVAIASCDKARFNDPTSFQVDNLLPGAHYVVSIDGQRNPQPIVPTDGSITIETRVGSHTIVVQQAG